MVRASKGSPSAAASKVLPKSKSVGVTKKERRELKKVARPLVDKRTDAKDDGTVQGAVAKALHAISRKDKKKQVQRQKRKEVREREKLFPSAKTLLTKNSSSLPNSARENVIRGEIPHMHNMLRDQQYQADPTGTLLKMIQSNMLAHTADAPALSAAAYGELPAAPKPKRSAAAGRKKK
eukprot:PhM_4_TR15138/c0_g1_i1/m.74660